MKVRSMTGCVLTFVIAFLIGVVTAPWIHVAMWASMLEVVESETFKLKAAMKLSETELGTKCLHKMVSRPNSKVRSPALSVLCATQKPWEIYSLFDLFRRPEDQSQYKEILNALNFSEELRQVIKALRYEYEHQTDAGLKARIGNMLDEFGYKPVP